MWEKEKTQHKWHKLTDRKFKKTKIEAKCLERGRTTWNKANYKWSVKLNRKIKINTDEK